MEDQHKKITGYRDLTQEEIDLMNKIKEMGEQVKELVGEVRVVPDYDQRWVSIAVTNLQQGFMALVRAVARPSTF